jgi:subtilisin family serine protease
MKLSNILIMGAVALVGFSALNAQGFVSKDAILNKAAMKAQRKANMRPEAVPGEFVVKMRVSGMGTLSQSVNTLAQFGLKLKEVVNAEDGVVLVKSVKPQLLTLGSASHARVMDQVSQLGNVEYIEPNFIYRALDLPTSIPNDADFTKLWAMKNQGQADKSGRTGLVGADIKAPEAWAISTGSREVVVAVIDTGVNYNHPDLRDNIWTSPNNPRVKGFNAINGKLDPMDDHSHGTHCAGSIAATGDNGIGVVGVTWKARIMGVKFLSASGSGTLADAVKAIDWATNNGAQIMSNSWGGGGYSQALADAIIRARDKGILFVAAAGNDSNDNDARPSYPASYQIENVVSVAASNNVDDLSYFSNYGRRTVHLMAPGENIYSTVLGDSYDTYSGTSMATPHVSGAAALLLAKEPSLTYAQVKERLINSTDKSRAFRGKVASMGRLNVYNLLANITGPGPVIPPESSWSSPIVKKIESAHPYPHNAKETFTIAHNGARFIRVRFSRVDLESGFDFVKLYNQDGTLAESITGRKNAFWTNEIEGSEIKVEFTSDDSVNGFGFEIEAYSWTDFNGNTQHVQVR